MKNIKINCIRIKNVVFMNTNKTYLGLSCHQVENNLLMYILIIHT